ncbi:hypothetical protein BDM02DRAFT_3117294 [Thelephora ganbajun]|uniref:Uncharacterized protein n=1 Tax=Thelephora ganbajun TaxID=370292 RepID=A0ACB6ZDN3_THEGA|nr:hypothetical protein BDM02DRAFT_3117294 [Thelephora ganbajun]
MTYYTSSVAVDPISAPSIVSQPTSQALVLANPNAGAMQYPSSAAVTIPMGRNRYMYGSYSQPVQYGYPQSMPMYVQPQQQVVYTLPTTGYNMPTTYTVPNYGYGMPMTTSQYIPGMGMGGASVIVQDPYGYSRRRSRRHRRHSYSGYPTYGY